MEYPAFVIDEKSFSGTRLSHVLIAVLAVPARIITVIAKNRPSHGFIEISLPGPLRSPDVSELLPVRIQDTTDTSSIRHPGQAVDPHVYV